MENKYIGITFGPICRIASMARSTKAIWASSYIFSYLAKNIIREFYLTRKRNFLLPQWSENESNTEQTVFEPHNGAGLFPDRYIFESKDDDFTALKEKKQEVIADISEKISRALNKDKAKVQQYIEKSIKVFFVEKEYGKDSSPFDIIKGITSSLDILDCEDLFCEEIVDGENYFEDFFELANSFLMADGFGKREDDSQDHRLIKTIFEYSACELQEESYWKKFGLPKPNINLVAEQGMPFVGKVDKKVQDRYMQYHNYIAIVKADGDYMGDTLKAMAEKGISIYNLDKNLLAYNLSVIEKIQVYGGVPIFLGGDDLLFFAPVVNGDHKNIFSLIDEINDLFNEQMKNIGLGNDLKLTLSFGVSITYYRHPMHESLDMAEQLLWDTKNSGKNCIKWQLRKHSGQIISGVLPKKYTDFYKESVKLIQDNSILNTGKENDRIFSSFVYWINGHWEMIKYAMDTDNSGNKLGNYFQNSFDEQIHSSPTFKILKEDVFKIFVDFWKKVPEEILKQQVYGILRFILFIKNCE